MGKGSWGVQVLTWILLALAAVVALKLAVWVVGAAIGLGMFLLFTVVPLAVLGWLVLKVLRAFRRDEERPA